MNAQITQATQSATAAAVVLASDVTITEAAEVFSVLLEALASSRSCGSDVVWLDLGQVSELDTAGLQVLLLAARQARRLGTRVGIAAASAAVRQVLALARLDQWLAPTLEGASW